MQDYIAHVTEINDYLTKFPPVTQGGNATKLPDNKLLDLLELRIIIKWQWQMQVQNLDPMDGTLRNFQDFCKPLESTLDDPLQTTNLIRRLDRRKTRNTIRTTTTTRKRSTIVFCTGITLRNSLKSSTA